MADYIANSGYSCSSYHIIDKSYNAAIWNTGRAMMDNKKPQRPSRPNSQQELTGTSCKIFYSATYLSAAAIYEDMSKNKPNL